MYSVSELAIALFLLYHQLNQKVITLTISVYSFQIMIIAVAMTALVQRGLLVILKNNANVRNGTTTKSYVTMKLKFLQFRTAIV